MVQLLSSIVDIRTSCYAARLAAFSSPQKHCKALIFRGALDPKKSYEQLMRRIVLVQEHRQMLTERIDHYLRSKEARLISWLIKSLPKGNLSPQSSGTPR
jgi:hypothetical protein